MVCRSGIVALPFLIPLPAAGQEDGLLCQFRIACDTEDCTPETFRLELARIDQEGGLWFTYDGISAPVRDVTPEDAMTRSFITLGHADRELLTVFDTGDAIHIRQYYQRGHGPRQQTAFGQCEVQ